MLTNPEHDAEVARAVAEGGFNLSRHRSSMSRRLSIQAVAAGSFRVGVKAIPLDRIRHIDYSHLEGSGFVDAIRQRREQGVEESRT